MTMHGNWRWILALTAVLAGNPAAGETDALHAADILQVLPPLTDTNAADLLVNAKGLAVVIAYNTRTPSQGQQEQLEMFARESHDYAGLVGFYALDVDRYPRTWEALAKGRPWNGGPLYFMINSAAKPPEIAMMVDTVNNTKVPVTSATKHVLRDHINFFLKVPPLVWHITEPESFYRVGVPWVLFVYRGTSPQTVMMPMQFQNFAYVSQLYPNRVAFGLIDRDVFDPSQALGFDFPKQDNAYYVLFAPGDRKPNKGVGTVINNPFLTTKDIEYAVFSYFGPKYGPVELQAEPPKNPERSTRP